MKFIGYALGTPAQATESVVRYGVLASPSEHYFVVLSHEPAVIDTGAPLANKENALAYRLSQDIELPSYAGTLHSVWRRSRTRLDSASPSRAEVLRPPTGPWTPAVRAGPVSSPARGVPKYP